MQTVPLSEAKDQLSALVDDVQSTHQAVTITRHGRPAAVLMAVDDLESLQETLF
jgi:prevent-host-death family protein